MDTKKLKILMLHGYTQNGQLFKDRTGGIRKSLKQQAELVYCDAPFDVPRFTQPETMEDELRDQPSKGWYTKTHESNPAEDVEKSLDYLNNIFKTIGPFDGVWGFSQGATMVHFLTNIAIENRHQKSTVDPNRVAIQFRFSILTATSKSAHPFMMSLEKFYQKDRKLEIPSLHIIGKTDKITNFERALELADYYEKPRIYLHELGHFIPGDKESKKCYSEFLQEINTFI